MAKTGNRELFGVQMLRAVAAFAVVVHHALEESNGALRPFSPDWFTTSGAAGVDIFFVISGFIMLHVSFPQDRPPARPGTFLFRRATRIYPFYWACCLAMLAVVGAGFLSNHAWSPRDIVASVLLAPTDNPLVGVSWTLVYEIYFYLVFAATLSLRSRGASVLLTSAGIVLLTLLAGALPPGAVRNFLINPIAIEFCMGLGLAWAFAALRDRNAGWPVPVWVFLVGIALLALAAWAIPHASTNGLAGFARVIFWGVPSALVMASVLTIGAPNGPAGRFMVLLGDASYALYLTHAFVMTGYGFLIKRTAIGGMDQPIVVVLISLLSIAIGIAAHLLVEKRLLALTTRIFHRPAGHVSPQSAR